MSLAPPFYYVFDVLLHKLTPWRNGSASDSRSEGCVFESRRGQLAFLFFRKYKNTDMQIHSFVQFKLKPKSCLLRLIYLHQNIQRRPKTVNFFFLDVISFQPVISNGYSARTLLGITAVKTNKQTNKQTKIGHAYDMRTNTYRPK